MNSTNHYTAKQVVDFWFSEQMSPHWFKSSAKIDQNIRQHYQALWQQADAGKLDNWMNNAISTLALIIVLDQFPLNMFRGDKKAFLTEQKAVQTTLNGIKQRYDKVLNKQQQVFFYMPLMHSEDMTMQNLILDIATKTKAENLDFVIHHHGIVQRFGRFPHRNKILNRKNTAEETKYLNSSQAFIG